MRKWAHYRECSRALAGCVVIENKSLPVVWDALQWFFVSVYGKMKAAGAELQEIWAIREKK